MADNTAQGGTDTIATDDISGVKHQRVKVEYGADGSATDVAAATPLPVRVGDGTTQTDILAGDTGQNSLITSGARKEITFSLTAAGGSTAWDVSNYRWVSVHITTAYTTMTSLTFQVSNDNTNWSAAALVNVSSTASAASSATASTNAVYHGPISARYFRLSAAGTYTSGATAGVIEFSANPGALVSTGVLATLTGALALTATTGNATGNINTARVTGTGTASATQIVAAPGASLSIYVTGVYWTNTGAADSLMTLLPASGTAVHDFLAKLATSDGRTFPTPWKLAANTALQYTVGTATTTWYLTCHYYVAA